MAAVIFDTRLRGWFADEAARRGCCAEIVGIRRAISGSEADAAVQDRRALRSDVAMMTTGRHRLCRLELF